jgi:hypothetical protein
VTWISAKITTDQWFLRSLDAGLAIASQTTGQSPDGTRRSCFLTGSRRDIGIKIPAMRPQAQNLSAQRVYAIQASPGYVVGAAIHQNSSDLNTRRKPSKGNARLVKSDVERFQNVQQDADRRLPPGGNPRCCRSR